MKAKEFDIKKRNPNWRTMQDIRRSGAGGQHQDKKRADKQGDVKHKAKQFEQGVAEEGYGTHPSQRVDPRTGKKYVPPKSPLGKGVAEATGDKPFDSMMKNIKKGTAKQATADRREARKQSQQRARDAFGSSPADRLSIRSNKDVDEDLTPTQNTHFTLMNKHRVAAQFAKGAEKDKHRMAALDHERALRNHDQGAVKYKDKDVAEGSDFGEPREILEDVLQTLEREVEWPLTEVMDPREVRQLLAPIVRAVNDKLLSMAEGMIPFDQCPECRGPIFHESMMAEKQDACYHKVRSRYKVWPSAYASGALVQCRKKGAANWGSKRK